MRTMGPGRSTTICAPPWRSMSLLYAIQKSRSADSHPKIDALPPIFSSPVEGEQDLAPDCQFRGIEVGKMHAETAVLRGGVTDSSPAVGASMNSGGSQNFDPKDTTCRKIAALVIDAPNITTGSDAIELITLARLRRHIEDATVRQRA